MPPLPPRRALVVANPIAGRGRARARAERLAAGLRERGAAVRLCFTGGRGDAAAAVRAAEDIDLAVCVGGDGTLAEVLSALPPSVPVAVLPMGTANVMATDLRLPRRVAGVLAAIDGGRVQELDTATVRTGPGRGRQADEVTVHAGTGREREPGSATADAGAGPEQELDAPTSSAGTGREQETETTAARAGTSGEQELDTVITPAGTDSEQELDTDTARVGGRDVDDAASLAGTGRERLSFLVTGVGIDGAIVRDVEARRRGPITKAFYVLSVLRTLWHHRPRPLAVEVDGAQVPGPWHWVLVSNIIGYGGFLRLSPDRVLDDGRFEVFLFPRGSRWALVGYGLAGLLRRLPGRWCKMVRARQVRVTAIDATGADPRGAEPPAAGEVDVEIDGDYGGTTPVLVTLNAERHRLIVP